MISGARKLAAQHLSIRVPWHDAGWKGSVCARPDLNTAEAQPPTRPSSGPPYARDPRSRGRPRFAPCTSPLEVVPWT